MLSPRYIVIGYASGVQQKGLSGNVNLEMVSIQVAFRTIKWTSPPRATNIERRRGPKTAIEIQL